MGWGGGRRVLRRLLVSIGSPLFLGGVFRARLGREGARSLRSLGRELYIGVRGGLDL